MVAHTTACFPEDEIMEDASYEAQLQESNIQETQLQEVQLQEVQLQKDQLQEAKEVEKVPDSHPERSPEKKRKRLPDTTPEITDVHKKKAQNSDQICCIKECHETGENGRPMYRINKQRDKAGDIRWFNALSRAKKPIGIHPKVRARICWRHFVNGEPSFDPNDVNYVPTLCLNVPPGTGKSLEEIEQDFYTDFNPKSETNLKKLDTIANQVLLGQYVCQYCPENLVRYKAKSSWRNHLLFVHKTAIYPCWMYQCKSSYWIKSELKDHMTNYHGIKEANLDLEDENEENCPNNYDISSSQDNLDMISNQSSPPKLVVDKENAQNHWEMIPEDQIIDLICLGFPENTPESSEKSKKDVPECPTVESNFENDSNGIKSGQDEKRCSDEKAKSKANISKNTQILEQTHENYSIGIKNGQDEKENSDIKVEGKANTSKNTRILELTNLKRKDKVTTGLLKSRLLMEHNVDNSELKVATKYAQADFDTYVEQKFHFGTEIIEKTQKQCTVSTQISSESSTDLTKTISKILKIPVRILELLKRKISGMLPTMSNEKRIFVFLLMIKELMSTELISLLLDIPENDIEKMFMDVVVSVHKQFKRNLPFTEKDENYHTWKCSEDEFCAVTSKSGTVTWIAPIHRLKFISKQKSITHLAEIHEKFKESGCPQSLKVFKTSCIALAHSEIQFDILRATAFVSNFLLSHNCYSAA